MKNITIKDPVAIPSGSIPETWNEIDTPSLKGKDRAFRVEFEWVEQQVRMHFESVYTTPQGTQRAPLGCASCSFASIMEANPEAAPAVLDFLKGLVYSGYLELTKPETVPEKANDPTTSTPIPEQVP